MRVLFSLIVITALFTSNPASALFELRGHVGAIGNGPDFTSQTAGLVGKVPALPVVGLDIIVTPPLFPVGLGVRFDTIGGSLENNGISAAVTSQVTSLLVNYRVLDSFLWVGAIGSYGLSTSNTRTISGGGFTVAENPTGSAYSIGLEGGLSLLGFKVGLEVGQQGLTVGGENLGGAYSKVLIGWGI